MAVVSDMSLRPLEKGEDVRFFDGVNLCTATVVLDAGDPERGFRVVEIQFHDSFRSTARFNLYAADEAFRILQATDELQSQIMRIRREVIEEYLVSKGAAQ